jgi:6-pyruvoyltetrahydropterin/6-carboxytetrahydropterin synthase
MNVRMTRRAQFSAAHNYYLSDLSEGENRELFGSHAADEGHGHNYSVAVSVDGDVDETSGVVVNIVEIDRAIKQHIITALDGKFLNRQVPYFKVNAPSTENLVQFVWNNLINSLPERTRLVSVEVSESDRLWASWTLNELPNIGEREADVTEIQLTRKYDFSAAHRLHSNDLSPEENIALFGKCNHANFHGHNYDIEVTLAGTPNKRSGMLFDLDKLDLIVTDEILTPMDHRNLNLDIAEFETANPTSEMLAVVIWNRLAKRLSTHGSPRLAKVLVRETPRNEFEYCGK